MSSSHNNRVPCEHQDCTGTFTRRIDMVRHLNEKHRDPKQCPWCIRKYKRDGRLFKHMDNEHRPGHEDCNYISDPSTDSGTEEDAEIFQSADLWTPHDASGSSIQDQAASDPGSQLVPSQQTRLSAPQQSSSKWLQQLAPKTTRSNLGQARPQVGVQNNVTNDGNSSDVVHNNMSSIPTNLDFMSIQPILHTPRSAYAQASPVNQQYQALTSFMARNVRESPSRYIQQNIYDENCSSNTVQVYSSPSPGSSQQYSVQYTGSLNPTSFPPVQISSTDILSQGITTASFSSQLPSMPPSRAFDVSSYQSSTNTPHRQNNIPAQLLPSPLFPQQRTRLLNFDAYGSDRNMPDPSDDVNRPANLWPRNQ